MWTAAGLGGVALSNGSMSDGWCWTPLKRTATLTGLSWRAAFSARIRAIASASVTKFLWWSLAGSVECVYGMPDVSGATGWRGASGGTACPTMGGARDDRPSAGALGSGGAVGTGAPAGRGPAAGGGPTGGGAAANCVGGRRAEAETAPAPGSYAGSGARGGPAGCATATHTAAHESRHRILAQQSLWELAQSQPCAVRHKKNPRPVYAVAMYWCYVLCVCA